MFLYYILISTGQNNYKIVAKEGRRLLVRKYAVPMLTCLSLEMMMFHNYNQANWSRWPGRKYHELHEKVMMKYNNQHHNFYHFSNFWKYWVLSSLFRFLLVLLNILSLRLSILMIANILLQVKEMSNSI